jgi:hypothetical protein
MATASVVLVVDIALQELQLRATPILKRPINAAAD